jgi:hypothetical protein
VRRIAAAGALVAVLGGCSTAEYTTNHAHDDLVRLGWTSTEAQCFVSGLRSFYAQRYVEANKQEDAKRGIKFTGVNPEGSDLYVRNELSNSGSLSPEEIAKTHALVQQCRANQ